MVRLAKGENYGGYIASKMIYFYGSKLEQPKFIVLQSRSVGLSGRELGVARASLVRR
jgi:hypothetical protein